MPARGYFTVKRQSTTCPGSSSILLTGIDDDGADAPVAIRTADAPTIAENILHHVSQQGQKL
jgi:hypothetical protein